jgi:hypothetical protein
VTFTFKAPSSQMEGRPIRPSVAAGTAASLTTRPSTTSVGARGRRTIEDQNRRILNR